MVVDVAESRSRWALPILRISVGEARDVELLAGRWLGLAAHWLGRLMLCGGEGCVRCLCEGPVVRGYRLCVWGEGDRRGLGVVEATFQGISQLEGLAKMEGLDPSAAIVVRLGRASRNRGVRMDPLRIGLTMMEEREMDARLYNALSLVFGVPMLNADGDVDAWEDAAAKVAVAKVAAAVARMK